MIYGPKSTKTVPAHEVRKSATRYMPMSKRRNAAAALKLADAPDDDVKPKTRTRRKKDLMMFKINLSNFKRREQLLKARKDPEFGDRYFFRTCAALGLKR